MSELQEGEAAKAKAGRGREWLLLAVLAAVQFMHVVDFVIIMPLGPQLMRAFQITPQQFGLIVSAYTFAAAAAGFAVAFGMDRYDRKTALLGLLSGFGVGTLLCAYAPTYELLVAARVVAGAFGGVLTAVIFAIIGDQIPAARRGTATGIVMAGFSVASTLGVPIGLMVAARAGWHATFLVLAAVTAAIIALVALALPPMRAHLGGPRRSPVREVAEVLREPVHLRAFALSFMVLLGGFSLAPFLAPYLAANVGVGESGLQYVYLFGGIFTLFSGPLAGRLGDRFGHARVFSVAAVLSTVPVLVVTNLGRVPLATALVASTVFMVMMSSRWVPVMALITGSVEPRMRGAFMSVNSSIQQLTAGFASMLAGLMVGGSAETGFTGYGRVGLLSCAAVLLSLPLAHRLKAAQQARSAARAPAPEPTAAPVPATAGGAAGD